MRTFSNAVNDDQDTRGHDENPCMNGSDDKVNTMTTYEHSKPRVVIMPTLSATYEHSKPRVVIMPTLSALVVSHVVVIGVWVQNFVTNFNGGGIATVDKVGILTTVSVFHDDVIKWKHFPRYWPFVRGIQRSPVNSPHKGQWSGAWMFSLNCVWINGWVNNREAGDLRRYRAHYDVIVISEFPRTYPHMFVETRGLTEAFSTDGTFVRPVLLMNMEDVNTEPVPFLERPETQNDRIKTTICFLFCSIRNCICPSRVGFKARNDREHLI